MKIIHDSPRSKQSIRVADLPIRIKFSEPAIITGATLMDNTASTSLALTNPLPTTSIDSYTSFPVPFNGVVAGHNFTLLITAHPADDNSYICTSQIGFNTSAFFANAPHAGESRPATRARGEDGVEQPKKKDGAKRHKKKDRAKRHK
jgi:hypothetical protein